MYPKIEIKHAFTTSLLIKLTNFRFVNQTLMSFTHWLAEFPQRFPTKNIPIWINYTVASVVKVESEYDQISVGICLDFLLKNLLNSTPNKKNPVLAANFK